MKKKKGKKYIERDGEKIITHLRYFLASADQADLHQFRLQVKKLKSLIMILGGPSGSHKLLKYFKPVNKIYKKAGGIRKAYVNLQLIHQYHFRNHQFDEEQRRIVQKESRAFCSKGPGYIQLLKKVFPKLKKKVRTLSDQFIDDLYRYNLKRIAAGIRNPACEKCLHDCRKRIKLLISNYKISKKALKKGLRLNMEYLDILQDRIGQWHDNIITSKRFSSMNLKNPSFLNKLNSKEQGLRNRVILLGNHFLKKAIFR